jgi:hypothetical protein
MKYFSNLPKILYANQNGSSVLYTNLMARASIKENLLNNTLLYYTYDIQEGDTPEIIAHKYYGDVYRYWIILLTNQIMDPQWSWPLSGRSFEKYLQEKYGNNDPTDTVHHYEKIITTTDTVTKTKTVNYVTIDEETYDTMANTENGYSLPNGDIVIVQVQKNIVSNYEYEFNLNESRRNIKILNVAYANQLEQELEELMK